MHREDFTVFVGNLSDRVDEEILYELFLQAGPVREVRIPAANGARKSYGFVEFRHEVSVPYALQLLDRTKLFGRAIMLNSRSQYLHLYQPPPPRIHTRQLEPNMSMRPDDSSLRMAAGGLGRKFLDKSMMPSGPPRKNQKRKNDSSSGRDWGQSWQPKEYPSQNEESKNLRRGNYNDDYKYRNRYESISRNSRNSHHKALYYNEKHHNRDKSRHDSHSSQRSRSNHPYNR